MILTQPLWRPCPRASLATCTSSGCGLSTLVLYAIQELQEDYDVMYERASRDVEMSRILDEIVRRLERSRRGGLLPTDLSAVTESCSAVSADLVFRKKQLLVIVEDLDWPNNGFSDSFSRYLLMLNIRGYPVGMYKIYNGSSKSAFGNA